MLPVLVSQVPYSASAAPARHQKLSQHPSTTTGQAHNWPHLASPPPTNAMAVQNRMRPLRDLVLDDRVRISMAHKLVPLKEPPSKVKAGLSDGYRSPSIMRRINWKDARKAGLLHGQATPPTIATGPSPPVSNGDALKGDKAVILLRQPCPCYHCFKTSMQTYQSSRSTRWIANFSLPPPALPNTARKPSRAKRRSTIPSTPLFRLGFSTPSLRTLELADKYHQALVEDFRTAKKKKEVREKLLERRKKATMTSSQMLHHQFGREELEERWRGREVNGVIGKAVQDMSNEHTARRREYQRIQAYAMKDCTKARQKLALARRAMAKC